jgi:hypothetical protein
MAWLLSLSFLTAHAQIWHSFNEKRSQVQLSSDSSHYPTGLQSTMSLTSFGYKTRQTRCWIISDPWWWRQSWALKHWYLWTTWCSCQSEILKDEVWIFNDCKIRSKNIFDQYRHTICLSCFNHISDNGSVSFVTWQDKVRNPTLLDSYAELVSNTELHKNNRFILCASTFCIIITGRMFRIQKTC